MERQQQLERTFKVVRAYGLTPVPIRPGAKAPTAEWDCRTVISDPEPVLAAVGAGNIAVHLHGRVVDVDVDSFDPLLTQALDLCLPPSVMVWGRAAKPRSHRVYLLTDDFNRDKFLSVLRALKYLTVGRDSLSVEIRGGDRTAAQISVMPGSQHPSGELYTWDDLDTSTSPPLVQPAALVTAVRTAAAAAMLARFWVSGVRNEMSLALAGALWRMHSVQASIAEQTDDVPPDPGEAMARAEALMNAVMTLADDDANDRRDRLSNLRNTWRKLERDPSAKAIGATRLGQLCGEDGAQVVRKLFLLLCDDPGALAFEELAERFRIWYGQGVLIDLDLVTRGLPQFWMTKEQASNSMGGSVVTLGGKRLSVPRLLFASQAVGRVYGVTFDPATTDLVVENESGAFVNQWRGFKTKPHQEPVSDAEVRPFLEYAHAVIAAGDDAAYNWVLDWCADILQAPGRKPGTALVLVGEQGAGKTFLGECVLGPIIGPAHYGQTNSMTSLTDRFNQQVDNKLLLQCDEALHSYQRDVAARLKALITDATIKIEPKFVNPFIKPNHMRFMFTSNEETAALFVDPTPAERRFTVLKVSAHRVDDVAWWTDLRKWTEANLSKIMRWLLDRKYSKPTIMRPYSTAAKRALQGVGVPLEVSWMNERLQAGFPLDLSVYSAWWQAYSAEREDAHSTANQLLADRWPDVIHLPTLEEDFRRYVRERGKPLHTGNVWLTMRSVFPEGSVGDAGQKTVNVVDPRTQAIQKRRVRLHTLPSAADVAAHLRRRYGDVFGAPLTADEPTAPEHTNAEY